ncbi:MAG TPA: rhomboid family intramembrane serine protease [Lacunisphaera sp.]|nr:rhomboid family intramembrane serine protease [Lacunisphaera sp.]
MLSDRSYMRSEYPPRNTSAVVWLIAVLVAAFALELILLSPLFPAGPLLANQLSLTIGGLRAWHVWTLVTHSFLHSTDNPFHILFTILGLVFLGRELEPVLGPRRFLLLYAGAILVGGLCWTAVHWLHGGVQIGAGAGMFAFLVVLARIYPGQELTMFFFPVSFNIRHIVYAFLAVDLMGLVFYEINGTYVPLGLTPSAHLGGMLAGWIYFRFFHANNGWDRAAGLTLPAWLRRRTKNSAAAKPSAFRAGQAPSDFRAEVDRILDKINSQGFGALTDEEKRILDEAKDLLSRH